jgi:dTMP kinase
MRKIMRPGFFIAIEGIDGAGKTTQAHLLQAALQQMGFPVIRTKEPTTGKYGQILRDSALTGRLSAEEEVEVFVKDRREHVDSLIIPELKAGKIVIVDRYYFSTAAYQGCRGLNPEELLIRNEAFAPEPDLLVVIDIDPKLGLDRIRTRGDRANLFEKDSTLKKARAIFKNIQRSYKFVVDGSLTAEDIKTILLGEIRRRFEAKKANSKAASSNLAFHSKVQ